MAHRSAFMIPPEALVAQQTLRIVRSPREFNCAAGATSSGRSPRRGVVPHPFGTATKNKMSSAPVEWRHGGGRRPCGGQRSAVSRPSTVGRSLGSMSAHWRIAGEARFDHYSIWRTATRVEVYLRPGCAMLWPSFAITPMNKLQIQSHPTGSLTPSTKTPVSEEFRGALRAQGSPVPRPAILVVDFAPASVP